MKRSIIMISGFIIFLCCIIFGAYSYWKYQSTIGKTKKIMNQYIEAYNDKDYEKVKELLHFESADGVSSKDIMSCQLQALKETKISKYKIDNVKKESDSMYKVNHEIVCTPCQDPSQTKYTAYVIKVNGSWKIALSFSHLPKEYKEQIKR